MNKLHSLTLCAIVTPLLTFSASSLLAQETTGHDTERNQQNTQREQGATRNGPVVTQDNGSNRRPGQTDARNAANTHGTRDQSRTENKGYMRAAPMGGIQASNLIDAEVKTIGDEDIGPVQDLIIDHNGQIVAIVVGVGGFLSMGEKDVAIGWDDVTMSGEDDDQHLLIDVTREDLRSAPEFDDRD